MKEFGIRWSVCGVVGMIGGLLCYMIGQELGQGLGGISVMLLFGISIGVFITIWVGTYYFFKHYEGK